MDGLDVTLVLDCRICCRIFRLARMGRLRSRARRRDGTLQPASEHPPTGNRQRSAQNGANFGNAAKAICQSILQQGTRWRRRASEPPARLGGRFDTGINVSRCLWNRAQLAMRNLLTMVLEANDE